MEIYYKKDSVQGDKGFCWAWKESMEQKVWGFAKTLEEIKRRASRMFPKETIELICL